MTDISRRAAVLFDEFQQDETLFASLRPSVKARITSPGPKEGKLIAAEQVLRNSSTTQSQKVQALGDLFDLMMGEI